MCLTSPIFDLTAHFLLGNTVYFLCRFRAIVMTRAGPSALTIIQKLPSQAPRDQWEFLCLWLITSTAHISLTLSITPSSRYSFPKDGSFPRWLSHIVLSTVVPVNFEVETTSSDSGTLLNTVCVEFNGRPPEKYVKPTHNRRLLNCHQNKQVF